VSIQERFSARSLYLYLVCLITLVICIFATINVARSVTNLLYPAPTSSFGGPVTVNGGPSLQSTDTAARDAQRRDAVLGLVTSGVTLLVAGPVYAYHWRRIQRDPIKPIA
jgi:hypothetical protein